MTPVRARPCHLCGDLSEYMLHHEPTDTWRCLHCLNATPKREREHRGERGRMVCEQQQPLIEMARDVFVQAKQSWQLSAATAALKELGVLSGLRIEKSEFGRAGEFRVAREAWPG
jgi:hypothetical protein